MTTSNVVVKFFCSPFKPVLVKNQIKSVVKKLDYNSRKIKLIDAPIDQVGPANPFEGLKPSVTTL